VDSSRLRRRQLNAALAFSALALCLSTLCLSSCATTAAPTASVQPTLESECVVRRAAFDIGSTTTKMKVADVDVCRGKLVGIVMAADRPVFYRDDLKLDPAAPRFRGATIARGLAVLRELRAAAEQHQPHSYAAVATSAFRRAGNARELTAQIERELGIRISIISQQKEAALGFTGAVHARGVDPAQAVVWDIGGHSMQLTAYDDGQFVVYEGELASGQMKDHIIRVVQRRMQASTPNPISPSEASEARHFCQRYATSHIPHAIKHKLAQPDTVVLGIGALKYYDDVPPAQADGYSRGEIEGHLERMIGASDDELGGPYASTKISDRILVAGFMRALGIERVVLANVNLTDGLLLDDAQWSARRVVQRPAYRRSPVAAAAQ
jgi:exopolyphosphatase/guanosine-5'-triphosphate,3'-diphosphate pyrophosphatase